MPTYEFKQVGVGSNDVVYAQVDPTHQATRVSLRPDEHIGATGRGGHYLLAANFTTNAGQVPPLSPWFCVRWADKLLTMALKCLTAQATITTVFGATQVIDVDVIRVTSFSENPVGGVTIVPSAQSQKMRSDIMGQSLLGVDGCIQISAGTPLGYDGGVLDTAPFGYAMLAGQIGTGPANTGFQPNVMQTLFDFRDIGEYPPTLVANEGFLIRNVGAIGATGVVKFGFTMSWLESSVY